MGSTNQRTELLRILLADDDPLHAFVLQCAISRLSQPTSFQRAERGEALVQKVRAFSPEFIILAGRFSGASEVRQIKQLTNGTPVICLVDTLQAAEATLAAGAADCVLRTHEDELGACLEKHLNGTFTEPHFRVQVAEIQNGKLSRAERKLEEFDRRVGAFLRRFAAEARLKWSKLATATQRGWALLRTETHRRFTEAKVKYLLRKQHRIIQSHSHPASHHPAAEPQRRTYSPAADEGHPSAPRSIQPEPSTSWLDVPQPHLLTSAAEESNEALRTLELSFKTLFHTALDAMFLVDGLGSILHINPAGCALLGATPADLLGENILGLVPETEKARAAAFWEALLIEGQQKSDLVLEATSGATRDVYLSGRTNLWFGVHLLIARDQTELKTLRAVRTHAA